MEVGNSEIPSEIVNLREEITRLAENRTASKKKQRTNSKRKAIKFVDINSNAKIDEIDERLLKEGENYHLTVDKYSKHEFMIIKGRIVDEGP